MPYHLLPGVNLGHNTSGSKKNLSGQSILASFAEEENLVSSSFHSYAPATRKSSSLFTPGTRKSSSGFRKRSSQSSVTPMSSLSESSQEMEVNQGPCSTSSSNEVFYDQNNNRKLSVSISAPPSKMNQSFSSDSEDDVFTEPNEANSVQDQLNDSVCSNEDELGALPNLHIERKISRTGMVNGLKKVFEETNHSGLTKSYSMSMENIHIGEAHHNPPTPSRLRKVSAGIMSFLHHDTLNRTKSASLNNFNTNNELRRKITDFRMPSPFLKRASFKRSKSRDRVLDSDDEHGPSLNSTLVDDEDNFLRLPPSKSFPSLRSPFSSPKLPPKLMDNMERQRLQQEIRDCLCRDDHRKMKQLIKRNHVDLNCIDERGTSLLHEAAYMGQLKCLRTLLKSGSKVNFLDHKGGTALHTAVEGEDIDAVKCLLEHKISIGLCDHGGFSALHYSVMFGDFNITQLLLRSGADPLLVTDYGVPLTPFQMAINLKQIEILDHMIGLKCFLVDGGEKT